MKNLGLILFSTLFIVFNTFAAKIPDKAVGKYAGEKPAYTAVKNNIEIAIERQDVFVILSESLLTLKMGKLSLTGNYTATKVDGGNYAIKAHLTNEKSVAFDVELSWDKKTKMLTLVGTNGEPDTSLEKLT